MFREGQPRSKKFPKDEFNKVWLTGPSPSDDPTRIDITEHRFESYVSNDDPLDQEISRRYLRFVLEIIVGCINELVELYYKWQDKEWVHKAYKDSVGTGKLHQNTKLHSVSREFGVDTHELRRTLIEYEKDWEAHDWVCSKEAAPFLIGTGVDKYDVIETAKALAFGSRELGVSEPDIRILSLPKFAEIRKTLRMKRPALSGEHVKRVGGKS